MSWYDPKQAAADPDNPAANEQIPYTEWNAMVTYLKDKIIDKTVNDAAIGNDKVLVYKTATSTFVFEAQSAVGAIDDLTDVTISGVPADDEVLAYNSGTSKWINQTAAEAGLATPTDLTAYLPLAGGTVAGALTLNGQVAMGATIDMKDYSIIGVHTLTPTGTTATIAGILNMDGHVISDVTNPAAAQDAATKYYADNRLFAKPIITTFADGYIPVYRTSSGKFEMEAGGGSAGLPVADTTNIVKGSADGTRMMRFEVDGVSTGTTRVMTVPDKNITLCDVAEVMLLSGAQAMTGDIHADSGKIYIDGYTATLNLTYSDVIMAAVYYQPVLGMMVLEAYDYGTSTPLPLRVSASYLDMYVRDIRDIAGLVLHDATELTIASGTVTATQSYHDIDTESGAASDDLDTINGGTAGQMLVLRAESDDRTVVVKHGTGNMHLSVASDLNLDSIYDTITLLYDGSNWIEISRSNNGS